jgi:hypothetical protein
LAGAIANYGIPLALGLLAAPIAGPLAAAAAAAGTTGVTKLTSGYTPKDALIAAAISGATAGALKGFTGPSNPLGLEPFGTAAKNAAAEAAAQGVGGAIAQGAGGALSQAIPGEILVSALKNAAPSLLSQVAPSVVQAGLSNLGQSLLPSQPATTQTPLAAQEPPPSFAALPGDSPLITVPGSVPSSNAFPSLAAGLSGVGNLGLKLAADQIAAEEAAKQRAGDEQPITVRANVLTDPASSIGSGLINAGSSLVEPTLSAFNPPPLTVEPAVAQQATDPGAREQPELNPTASKFSDFAIAPPIPITPFAPLETPAVDPNEIVVTANKKPLTGLEALPLTALGGLTGQEALNAPGTAADTPKKLGVSDYLRLAGLASSAIGLLGGGGGPEGTAAGIVPGGLGRLNPIFSAKLPTGADVNIPGGVGTASNLAARPVTDEDWLTYGQRPEKSFFNYVPQPPTGMAHGGSLEAKRGGRPSRSSFAVNGPGTGRSDDIPAVLSDGEYVIDAETVALLGDGSSKAGAQKLDDLRVKIRKHKGQRLSQGRFSSDAKKPEAYLTGGRI